MKSFSILVPHPSTLRRMRTRLLCLAVVLAGATSTAQTVYRCGNSYSQIPCAGAVTVPVDDVRSEAQQAQARIGVARDKALADQLEAQRLAEEAAAAQGALRSQARQERARRLQAKENSSGEESTARPAAGLRQRHKKGTHAKGPHTPARPDLYQPLQGYAPSQNPSATPGAAQPRKKGAGRTPAAGNQPD